MGDRPQGVAGDCNSLAETHAWFDSRVAHHFTPQRQRYPVSFAFEASRSIPRIDPARYGMWRGPPAAPSRRRTPGSIPGSPTTLPHLKTTIFRNPRVRGRPIDPPDRSYAMQHVAGAACGSLAETHACSIPSRPYPSLNLAITQTPNVRGSAPRRVGNARCPD